LCCVSFTVILLVTGVMNLSAMAIVAAAITIERLAARPEQIARAVGVVIIAAGAFVIARTVA
jgi:predicted metal-binding membrane protein